MVRRKVTVLLLKDEDGTYSVCFPLLPGAIADGNSEAEALEHAKEVLRLIANTADDDDAERLRQSHFTDVVVRDLEVDVAEPESKPSKRVARPSSR